MKLEETISNSQVQLMAVFSKESNRVSTASTVVSIRRSGIDNEDYISSLFTGTIGQLAQFVKFLNDVEAKAQAFDKFELPRFP